MREILFRGKRMNGGAWVEGSLICFADGCAFICVQSNNDDELDKYEIIPETIGQYTGLTDKNGTKIFEGDIVQSVELELRGVIIFDEYSRFMIKDITTQATYLTARNNEDIVVIGNIHDNPELLKGDTENEER